VELELFGQSYNKAFERTYGWTWLLKLQQELAQSPLDAENGWSAALKPLVDDVVAKYKAFLPSLVYPVRVGEHANTPFGLIFAYEYAKSKFREQLRLCKPNCKLAICFKHDLRLLSHELTLYHLSQ
jgi:hypothetical protein